MTVSETGHYKSRVLKTRYPVEEGLEAGTTKRTPDSGALIPEESFVTTSKVRGS